MMNDSFCRIIAGEIQARPEQVDAAVRLLDEGNTVPFIARYRKEITGGLDDTQLRNLETRLSYLRELEERRQAILKSISEQGKLTDDLAKAINATLSKTELEDLYLPYKPKRKTRSESARQKGLEPLATILLMQRENHLSARVRTFINKEVKDEEEALKGARDIIAEQVFQRSPFYIGLVIACQPVVEPKIRVQPRDRFEWDLRIGIRKQLQQIMAVIG